jgi:hypothetical protein
MYIYSHLHYTLPMQVERGGGGGVRTGSSTKSMGKFSSDSEKVDTSAAYRPCSAFDPCAMKFHLRHPNWFPNCQSKTGRRSQTLKGSHRMETDRFFLKISAPYSLMLTCQMNIIYASSISLDRLKVLSI